MNCLNIGGSEETENEIQANPRLVLGPLCWKMMLGSNVPMLPREGAQTLAFEIYSFFSDGLSWNCLYP